jgi:hypothetical protein
MKSKHCKHQHIRWAAAFCAQRDWALLEICEDCGQAFVNYAMREHVHPEPSPEEVKDTLERIQ